MQAFFAQRSSDELFSFDEALHRGVVDFSPNPWTSRHYQHLIDNIRTINPGIVNRFGFFYGGGFQGWYDRVGDIAKKLRAQLPKALLGGALPEHIKQGYDETLACGGQLGSQRFTFDQIALPSNGQTYAWLNILSPRAQTYYRCIGQIQIDRGLTYLHFENPGGVISQAADSTRAVSAYRAVRDQLTRYGQNRGKTIYWSGDSHLSHHVALDGVYIPARFYHNTTATQYRNRIARPGVGSRGYSYALSQAIIDDVKRATAPSTRVMFYVDNWDNSQDDLRRLMELDRINRRYLIRESGRIAHANGVVFIPSLNHCVNCVPNSLGVIGDSCNVIDSQQTQYDAHHCGDYDAIRDAMRPPTRIATAVDWINAWAVCSQDIARHTDCVDGCIYHHVRYPRLEGNPLAGATARDHALIRYHVDPSGYCQADQLERLHTLTTTIEWINEWAICSQAISAAGCKDRCIWHHRTALEYQHLNEVGRRLQIAYRKGASGSCFALDETLLPQ
jgi:hypothetical protein